MGSCNQNCENCAPGVSLFSISTSANVVPGGFGCLNGDSLPEGTLGYRNYNSRMAGSYTFSRARDNYAPVLEYRSSLNERANENGNSNYTYTIRGSVDGYGRYIETASAMSTFNAAGSTNNSYLYFPGLATYSDSSNIKTNINCKLVECDFSSCEVAPCNYFVCEENCSNSFSMSSNFTPGSNDFPSPRSESIQGNSCGGFPSCNPSEGSCTRTTCSSSTIEDLYCPPYYDGNPPCGASMVSADGAIEISSHVTISTAKGYSRSSVNTRMSILQNNSNQDPCGTNCGSGRDACWGAGFSFVPVDNTNNSYYSRAKVKVAASKEAMKPYSSVGGTVYFYENSTPGCCGEGNPIFTSNFSLGSSANFKNGTMVAQDVYSFENDSMQAYVGSTIVGCAKVTSVNIR